MPTTVRDEDGTWSTTFDASRGERDWHGEHFRLHGSYLEGKITWDQYGQELTSLHDQQFGTPIDPVVLSLLREDTARDVTLARSKRRMRNASLGLTLTFAFVSGVWAVAGVAVPTLACMCAALLWAFTAGQQTGDLGS